MESLGEALYTGAGMLWKALWALAFGYLISAGIQVIVSRAQMGRALGERGLKEGAMAGFFGFVSSSCSFAALAASRTVLVKGAHPSNSMAFLIASTNLVIELGIVLYVLLGWRFVLGNFALGLLMMLYAYLLTRIWLPQDAVDEAREQGEKATQEEEEHGQQEGLHWRDALGSSDGWRRIARSFVMEWKMVWKEILFGFTIAGFISVYIPQSFWNAIFLSEGEPSFFVVLENALVAPVVAFFTFIGSMGNVPLAAMLWSKQTSFGGVMSFLGADLVAATVVWIHVKYYGWKFALYLSGLLYVSMVAAGVSVHYLFAAMNLLPEKRPAVEEMIAFEIDYTFWLNLVFILISASMVWLHTSGKQQNDASAGHEN
ncbi:MAG: permease [Acidobacteria bacterium]|nr:permease [Acidobacteriota bacterium]